MKKTLYLLLLWGATLGINAQKPATLQQLETNQRRTYGTDFPYSYEKRTLTKAPKGYKPFYISHYARHGSRYYWTSELYKDLEKQLTEANKQQCLTPIGRDFYEKFMKAKDELHASVGELSDLGWEQHQFIARTMYNEFKDVFKKGGNVLAISSLSGRCVLSMSAFCQELVQCNPEIEIREQSSRTTLDGVVPTDEQNPHHRSFPRSKPRYEANRKNFKYANDIRPAIIERVFTNTDGLTSKPHTIANNLINLYTSLPSIGHEGMMEGIISDEEIASRWEGENLGTYSWVFGPRYDMIPILRDIINKADNVIKGNTDRVADLRFGHDTCLGPLTILMGINGADSDPEDPYKVKNIYQNWQTAKAANLQFIFYRSNKDGKEILVKCLQNGFEASLPLPTDNYPYYKWSDFKQFYTERCNAVK